MNMLDYTPVEADCCDSSEFVAMGISILNLYHTDKYEDDWVHIRRNYNGLALEITRKAQNVKDGERNSHLRVSNPTTMLSHEGNIIRHHGEYVWLTAHMRKLLEGREIRLGSQVKVNHPITVLNPDEFFAVIDIKYDRANNSTYVRGENTCWFNVNIVVEVKNDAD